MYERLPTPYGLVRYGVAPDHPEVKVSEKILVQTGCVSAQEMLMRE
jgi:NADPH-dependent glutamate synthase beta subunit-like oxidoreductase